MNMSGYIVVGILLALTIIARIMIAITNNEEDLKGICDAITMFLIVLIFVTLWMVREKNIAYYEK